MNFLTYGIPLGRYFGINVRLHFTFLVYAYYRVQEYHSPVLGLLFVAGIYACILLHEFGHALAARWCDGEANDILLWPLGGLAGCLHETGCMGRRSALFRLSAGRLLGHTTSHPALVWLGAWLMVWSVSASVTSHSMGG